MTSKRYLAMDFALGRGEAVLGEFDGKAMRLESVHRFPVQSTTMLGTEYWDFPAMLIGAKQGFRRYSNRFGSDLAGLAFNSWAMDFGLLDKTGHLLANPVHLSDRRTIGATQRLHSIIPDRSLYQKTGSQALRQVTLYQLFTMATSNSPLLDKAVTMLMMADLLSYFFTGTPVQEYTLATTTGMYDLENRDWSRDVILSAKIPPVMVPEIVAPGTLIGQMVDDVAAECGLGLVPVIAPASHGMADAVAAIPATGDDWAYLVSGYWNQVGVELPSPIINDDSFAAGFNNPGGVDGNYRLNRTLHGLGILVNLAARWSAEEGCEIGLTQSVEMAGASRSLTRLIDTEDPALVEADDVPAAINAKLREAGQSAADSKQDLARLCLDSIAMWQRHVLIQLGEVAGRRLQTMYLDGWGADNPAICQLTADACGIPVIAGPVQAKALGNILMQGIALGDIGSLAEARDIVRNSFEPVTYEPRDEDMWEDAYCKWKNMLCL